MAISRPQSYSTPSFFGGVSSITYPQPDTVQIFVLMDSDRSEISLECRLVGQLEHEDRILNFWSFAQGVPEINPQALEDSHLPYEERFLETREFHVPVPADFQGGNLFFKIVKKNLSTQVEQWNSGLNRRIPVPKELFPLVKMSPHLTPYFFSRCPFQTTELFAHHLDRIESVWERIHKQIFQSLGQDPQISCALKALLDKPRLLACARSWAFPLLHHTAAVLQKDPGLNHSFEQLVDLWKELPRVNRKALFHTIIPNPLLIGEQSTDPSPLVHLRDRIASAYMRLSYLCENDPLISSAAQMLQIDPDLFSAVHTWIFPLFDRSVTLAEKDTEMTQSMDAIAIQIENTPELRDKLFHSIAQIVHPPESEQACSSSVPPESPPPNTSDGCTHQ